MERLFAVLSLVLLVASGGGGTLFWALRDRGPDAALIPRAAEVVRQGWTPRDLVVIVPFYAKRIREHLGDLETVTVRDPLAEDLEVHPRVWIVGSFGEGPVHAERMLEAGYARRDHRDLGDGLSVDLLERKSPASTVVFSFMEHLPSAVVEHEKAGQRTRCGGFSEVNGQGGRMGGRWSCPYDSEWFYVAPEWHRMGGQTRRCLWAHPPNEGRLLITFPNVPMTGLLFGHAGHTLNGSRHARAAVDLDVQVGATASQRYSLELHEHWRPFALRTTTTGTTSVTFAISSADAGTNHFCFDAEMRR